MWNILISMQDISFIMHNGFNLVQCDEALKEWKQNVFQACKSKDTSFKHMLNSDNTQQTSSLLSPRLQLILFNQVFHQLLVHPGYRNICSRLNDLTQL